MTKHQLGLARYLKSQGQTFYREDKLPQAEEAHKRSVTILEKLAADHPQDMKISADLGSEYGLILRSLLFKVIANPHWSGRVVRSPCTAPWLRCDPDNLQIAQSGLSGALGSRAEILMRLGRHAEAIADFEEIVVG